MKKTVIILYLLSVCFIHVFGQEWIWSNQLQSNGDVFPSSNISIDIISDNSDNVYYSGHYDSNPLTIGNITIPNAGNWDGFICKFNPNGNILWANDIGGSGRDEATAMAIVGDYIFVIGNFRSDPVTFDPGITLPNYNHYDVFLAKYDLNGNCIKATRTFWGNDPDRVRDMYYDATLNRLVVVGHFKTDINYFNGSTDIIVNAQSNKDMFIAQLDTAGTVTRFKNFWTTNDNTILKDINPIQGEGYYLSGDLTGKLFFEMNDSIVGDIVNTDALALRIDNSLNKVWARRGGGTGYDHANSSVSDQYGSLYLTGKVESSVQFDSTETILTSAKTGIGAGDIFLVKYNKQGALRWFKRKGDVGEDDGYGIIQSENLVQFCGNYAGTLIFNIDTLRSTSITEYNTSFAIFDLTGKEVGAQGIEGDSTDVGRAITFDQNRNTIIGGYSNSDPLIIGDSIFSNGNNLRNGFIALFSYPMLASFSYIENIKCNGDNTGQLIVTPYFGVGPYTYNWSHNPGLNDSTASNLSAGTYSVTVTDSRDSTAFTSTTLNEPPPIAITSILTDVSCHPANGTSNNGSIDITAGGGTGPGTYAYAWEAISGSGINPTSEDQINLTMGKYCVTITDENLCAEDDTFNINEPDEILFTGSSIINHITIPPGSNGEVDLVVSGGTPGYSYSWTGPQSYSSSNEDISGLSIGGNYTVQVSDAVLAPNTCTADTSFTVLSDTMLIAYISDKTDVDCKGNYTGSATVDVSGGSGPFVYNWSNGATSQTINNLPTGSYSVTVNNATDTSITSVFINEPLYELSSTVVGTDLVCFRDNSGTANLSVSGGTLPYAYSWSNGTTTEDLIHVAASDYYVTVTDKNGCQVIDGVTLDEPAAMDIRISVDQPVLCHGDMTGILTATATGGTGTKTYVWDDPGNQTAQTATNLGGGFYNVTATDLNECTVVGNVQLTEPAVLTLTPVSYDISCAGEEDGTIILTISGGTPSFSFVWSNNEFTQNITGLEAGIYSVTVTDQHNCTGVLADIEILEPEGTTLVSEDVTNTSCFLTEDGSISIDAVNPVDNLTFSIDGSIYMNNNGVFLNLPQGNYEVWVMDGDGCEQLLTSLTVSGPGPITLDTTVTHALGNQGGTVIAVASGGNEPYNYFLISSSTDMDNSTGEFYDIAPDNYELYAVDNISCPSDTLLITILQTSSNIVIYDAFSPNADGRNDLWNIGNIGLYPDCKVIVFNTWGNKVFSSDGYTEPWDGKYNGKDLPAGTYYYTIDLGDGSEVLSGPVSIVR